VLEFVWNSIPLVRIGQWVFGAANGLVRGAEFGVQCNESQLIGRQIFFGKNRVGGALRDANSAVNALLRVNDEEVWTFLETVDRTNINAIREFAFDTVFSNNVGHDFCRNILRNG